jgi:hypothetical protein
MRSLFKKRCFAVTIDEYGACRCDLERNHKGDHLTERGMYNVSWSAKNTLTEKRYFGPDGRDVV